MPRAARRLARWREAPRSDGSDQSGLQRVRAHLDDDLDTPGAMAALDDEADAGRPVDGGAGLLGVTL
jgi:L-cysteine:1D-myo-inositol 2-amino-2-deoxy-alpha-D-glucopyranoside ligase